MFEDGANRDDVQAETTVAGKHLPYFGFTPERGALTQVKDALPVLPGPLLPTFLPRTATARLKSLPTLLALPFQPTVAGGPRPVDGMQAQSR